MSHASEDRDREGPAETGPPPPDDLPEVSARRPALWLLLVPAVLYCLAPLVANSVEPRVLGLPFLLFWIVAATIVSPLVIWLVTRLDPAYRTDAAEPLPGDRTATPAPGGPSEGGAA
ncbi:MULTISPECIES: DUF3311 domain-containing protein [Streptomyces]|uniref:DUF3311 domain-containing protein n=1 Tax=Streptomyces olivaceiscleroticus TaxID=68245 RepID=A0ABN1AAL1_9ACTN|nr:DUF3311 domain-containing protein [Streptomyces niger]